MKNGLINNNYDVVIIGAGMVGLSVANQLIEREITNNILVLEKEKNIGMHSSGRNSGVLHAGLYYPPNSLKAKVCLSGSRKLKKWIKERDLQINFCGKVILPQKKSLDSQLDLLASRGKSNGAKTEFWDNKDLKQKFPLLKSITGRSLWSPYTAVVKPSEILEKLKDELIYKGVQILTNFKDYEIDINSKLLKKNKVDEYKFKYLFNCSGIYASQIAKECFVKHNYSVIPFKGLYWKLKGIDLDKFNTNIYPVPDLNMPFLGVHFTPSFCRNSRKVENVFIGPTAILAFGKENYIGLENLEPLKFIDNSSKLFNLFFNNMGGIRKYTREQLFLSSKPFLTRAVKELIPLVNSGNINKSLKVGIRAQLFDLKKDKLVDDFLCINGQNSTHVLNAVSPAFTASFALADLIIDNSLVSKIT